MRPGGIPAGREHRPNAVGCRVPARRGRFRPPDSPAARWVGGGKLLQGAGALGDPNQPVAGGWLPAWPTRSRGTRPRSEVIDNSGRITTSPDPECAGCTADGFRPPQCSNRSPESAREYCRRCGEIGVGRVDSQTYRAVLLSELAGAQPRLTRPAPSMPWQTPHQAPLPPVTACSGAGPGRRESGRKMPSGNPTRPCANIRRWAMRQPVGVRSRLST